MVLFLGGSGTKGDGEEVKQHVSRNIYACMSSADVRSKTTWDGFGRLLSQYRKGNDSAVNKLAGERYFIRAGAKIEG
jgi:hypothetical protein